MDARAQRVWSFSAGDRRRFERRHALTVVMLFVLAGISWVLVTDAILYRVTRDPVLIARLETAKGWIFVALAGAFLYAVTLRSARLLSRSHAIKSAVIESIGDGVLLLGSDRKIRHANAAALRMLRCEDVGELVGMDAVEFSRRFRLSYPSGALVPPEEFASQRAFVAGGPLIYKCVLHPPDAPEVVIFATAAPVREEWGGPAEAVVSVMHDVTTEERLEQLRDGFFAAAAHALKTPVAVIKANAQIVGRDPEPRLQRATEAIDRQCGRIDRLVQNLLVLARARSKTLQLAPREVALAPLVERISVEMEASALQHEVHAEIAATPRVHADEERLAMVLRNLIDEAARSSRAGAPVTVLLARRGPDAEIGVRYRALPPEELTGEPYGEYDELGIGRCATETIVEAHGGARRDETEGLDAITWIRLPAIEEAAGAAR
jgi:signal transduction histidine kinase